MGIVKPAILKQQFTSISSFTEASLLEAEENEINPTNVKTKANSYKKLSKILKTTMQTINENVEQVEEDVEEAKSELPKQLHNKTNAKIRNNKLPEVKTVIKSIKILPSIDEEEAQPVTKIKAKAQSRIHMESLLSKCFKEWLTLETYIYIYGEKRIQQTLDEKKLSDYFETLNISKLNKQQQIKYLSICKRLHLQEMADRKFDNLIIEGDNKLNPLPDYGKLREESKVLNIKVKSFYSGALYEKENLESQKKKEESILMPMIDNGSQNALRKKIFLNSVNKSYVKKV